MNSPKTLFSAITLALSLALAACGSSSSSTPPTPPTTETPAPTDPTATPTAPGTDGAGCARTGCSNTVCAEVGKEVMTTCEMRPEYSCYASATCEKQADGACAWTQTEALSTCITANTAK
jgi:hypothetical protein